MDPNQTDAREAASDPGGKPGQPASTSTADEHEAQGSPPPDDWRLLDPAPELLPLAAVTPPQMPTQYDTWHRETVTL